jgi:predicted dehydrogenase
VTPEVLVIGGGMIVHDQILPSLYQLQRLGRIGAITICASTHETVARLAANAEIRRAFPGHTFRMLPDTPGPRLPELWRGALAQLPPRQIVFMALPDHLHYDVILAAVRSEQHVIAVKPMVHRYAQSLEIGEEARRRNLLVAVEYHKRFDDRNLIARRAYRDGRFGEFRLGSACLHEKWYYRESNFQNWMTADRSDAFSYVGCHYVDLVAFITGLTPVAVSVYGILDRFPNGAEGYLWTDARVIWSNGACLNVQNSLGVPAAAPGSNAQGLTMYCRGADQGARLAHGDQFRGVQYCYVEPAASVEPNPDFFQYVDLGGPGLTPVGYGYRSIEAIVEAVITVERGERSLDEIDAAGIIATPANSGYNDRVIEAGRESICAGGREVRCGKA